MGRMKFLSTEGNLHTANPVLVYIPVGGNLCAGVHPPWRNLKAGYRGSSDGCNWYVRNSNVRLLIVKIHCSRPGYDLLINIKENDITPNAPGVIGACNT